MMEKAKSDFPVDVGIFGIEGESLLSEIPGKIVFLVEAVEVGEKFVSSGILGVDFQRLVGDGYGFFEAFFFT